MVEAQEEKHQHFFGGGEIRQQGRLHRGKRALRVGCVQVHRLRGHSRQGGEEAGSKTQGRVWKGNERIN